jgi:hypothetical protein
MIRIAVFMGTLTVSLAGLASPFSLSVGPTRVHKEIKSYQEIKQSNVVMQREDYSCGAASLATIMTYFFNDDTSEQELLDIADELVDRDEQDLEKRGLSLLDLKHIAEHRGYRAGGFRLKVDDIKKLKGPVIIYFKPGGYEHFAVLKGVKGNRVFIADPSRGNYRQRLDLFVEEWDGVTLALDGRPAMENDTSPLVLHDDKMVQPERLSIERMMQAGMLTAPRKFSP